MKAQQTAGKVHLTWTPTLKRMRRCRFMFLRARRRSSLLCRLAVNQVCFKAWVAVNRLLGLTVSSSLTRLFALHDQDNCGAQQYQDVDIQSPAMLVSLQACYGTLVPTKYSDILRTRTVAKDNLLSVACIMDISVVSSASSCTLQCVYYAPQQLTSQLGSLFMS